MIANVIFGTLVVLKVLNVLCNVALIGRDKGKFTPAGAVSSLIVSPLLIAAYYYLWSH